MTATLAPIANKRGYHRLRTITYDELSAHLPCTVYVYSAGSDLWVPVEAISIGVPPQWGVTITNDDGPALWLSLPRVVGGFRRDERFCHVRYRSGGSIASEQLQDVRVGGAK